MTFVAVEVYRGLVDFVTAPLRVYRLHYDCINQAKVNAKKINLGLREKQAERRLQLQKVYEDPNQQIADKEAEYVQL
ncbi:hypothetical protein Ciccas_006791 [Cichlidogyrus casuarinus]|uniref:Uncharacterized protein n=1 Tax=Cichlidogyrus casuarinus TaxID=1844966 RepID=A0ABD2Q586_9PLAT